MRVPNRKEFEYGYWLAERIIESGFFDYNSIYSWEQEWSDYFANNYGVTEESGCTKSCFISTESDWVLKVRMPDNDCYRDYCYDEAKNYQYAIEEGIEECFAACYFLNRIGGYDFYIQEKVDIDEEAIDSTCYIYASNQCGSNDYEDINELYWDMDDYERVTAVFGGTDFKARLIDFIDNYAINDLHAGNFGYRDSFPVIIDYSGY